MTNQHLTRPTKGTTINTNHQPATPDCGLKKPAKCREESDTPHTGTVEVVTSYDARGKITAKTNPHTPATPSPPAVTYSYWPDGLVKSSTNQLGGADATVSYFYDARSNRVGRSSRTKAASTDIASHQVVESWTYDLTDRANQYLRPGETVGTTYTYNTLSGLADTITYPSGRVDTMVWWNNGEPKSITSTKPADSYGPAGTERTCSWHDTVSQNTVTLLDDVTNATPCTGGKATTRTWDHSGQLSAIVFPDTSNTPSGQDENFSYSWDLNGLPRTFTYPDGTVHQFKHDAVERLSVSAVVWSGGGGFPIAGYSYDDNSNVTKETINCHKNTRI